MAVTAKAYSLGLVRDVYNGTVTIDWDTNTFKTMLTTSAYAPDQDVHDRKDDVTNEVVGTGYTAGGVTLTSGNQTITYTAGTNTITLDGEDASWSNSTITARTAVVYKDTGTGSTSPLVCYQQSDADISSTAGTFSVVWNASGIVTFVVA